MLSSNVSKMLWALVLWQWTLTTPLLAEGDSLPALNFQNFKPSRKTASSRSYTSHQTIRGERRKLTRLSSDNSLVARLGVGAGLNFLSGSELAESSKNVAVAGQLDVRMKYVGLEFEGFYGLSSAPTASSEDGDQTMIQKETAIMPTLSFRLPFKAQYMKWTPKLGAGYSLFELTQTLSQPEVEGTDTIKTSVNSPVLFAGLEVEPIRFLRLSLDYARGISVKAKSEAAFAEGVTLNSETTDATFDRIRFSTYFYLSRSFAISAQYIRRNVTVSDTFASQQFLGFLMLEL